MSSSLWSHGLKPTRFLCPWNSPGKNTGMGCHSLLQVILLTQGSSLGLLHCRQIFYHWARVILYTLFKDYPTPTLKKKPTSLQWPLRSSAFWCFIIWLHYLLLSVCSPSSSQLGPCLSFNAQAHSYLRGFVRLLPPLNAFHKAFPAS